MGEVWWSTMILVCEAVDGQNLSHRNSPSSWSSCPAQGNEEDKKVLQQMGRCQTKCVVTCIMSRDLLHSLCISYAAALSLQRQPLNNSHFLSLDFFLVLPLTVHLFTSYSAWAFNFSYSHLFIFFPPGHNCDVLALAWATAPVTESPNLKAILIPAVSF